MIAPPHDLTYTFSFPVPLPKGKARLSAGFSLM